MLASAHVHRVVWPQLQLVALASTHAMKHDVCTMKQSVYVNAIERAVLMHESLPASSCTAYPSSSA